MKDKSNSQNSPLKQDDNLDETVHNSLVEMGWIFPRTEADVLRVEESLKGVACRPLPAEMADPSRFVHLLEQIDASANDVPLDGLLAAAKERGLSSKQLAAATGLSVVLVSMLDRGMIKSVTLPKVVVTRIAEAIGGTVERVIKYFEYGPRLALDTNFKADDTPELEEPQNFFAAVREDPTIEPVEREYLLSLEDKGV